MKLALCAAAATLWLAPVLIGAPAAATSSCTSIQGARACWSDPYESLSATDTAYDGYGVSAQLRRADLRIFTVVNDGGNGTTRSAVQPIPEDQWISIRACRTTSWDITCGAWLNFYS